MLDRERSAIRDLRLNWIDLIWLVFLGGLALLPPVNEYHKQLILLFIVVYQLFEGWIIGQLPQRGPAYSVIIKILAAMAAIHSASPAKPIHLIADQPIKADRLDAERLKPYRLDRLGEETACVTPEIVKLVGNYFLPGIIATDDLARLDAIDASHPNAPGYHFHVDFKDGCATKLEVTRK